MSIYNALNFVGEDARVRRYLLPCRIIETGGDVKKANLLLKQKSMQIGLTEKEFTTLKNGCEGENAYVILDFGIELHGGVRLMNYMFFEHAFDPEIKITFGESYSEVQSDVGQNGASNDHAVRQFKIPLPWLSDQEWGQTGFRFVKIELLSKMCKIELKSVLGVSVMRNLEYKGSFSCSDKALNKIFDTAAYTAHLCMQNLVWDGIKRDRLVWIGDMMPESMAARCLFGQVEVVEDSLEFVKQQTPLPNWMNNMPAYSMWWMMILKDWYFYTGNREFLNNQRDYVLGLSELLCSCVSDNGEDKNIDSYFVDWPTSSLAESKNGVMALLKMALISAEYLCFELSAPEKAELCRKKAKLLKIEDNCGGAKQIEAFLSLAGATDAKKAARFITKNSDAGFSTFLSYFILKAIANAGSKTKAISLMKKYYKRMLQKGATSFFEDFDTSWSKNSSKLSAPKAEGERDIHGDFGDYCYKGFRHSFCHGWSAGPVPFIMEEILGITALEPGCKRVKITPHLGSLEWAKGSFPTPYGIISINLTRRPDGSINSEISAPEEITVITE